MILAIFLCRDREPRHRSGYGDPDGESTGRLLQKLITLSQETGKPMSDLIEEVLDWARQQSQWQSRAS
jgi:hypothetical protein